jgi:hypothetical protein
MWHHSKHPRLGSEVIGLVQLFGLGLGSERPLFTLDGLEGFAGITACRPRRSGVVTPDRPQQQNTKSCSKPGSRNTDRASIEPSVFLDPGSHAAFAALARDDKSVQGRK